MNLTSIRKNCNIFFILAVYLLNNSCFSQNGFLSNGNWYIKPSINYGVILQHRAIMGNLIKDNVTMFEINLVKPSSGNKLWQLQNNKPDYGITFTMIDYGNPEVLGQSFSLAPFIEIPLRKKEKASRLIMRICWGVAYLNKPFNIETNPKNTAIGSNLNGFVQLRWQWNFNLGQRFRIEPGFSFSHASNGRIAVPNLGLNVITFNLGLTYKLIDKKIEVTGIDSSTHFKSRHELVTWYSYGLNVTGNPNGPKYPAHTLSLNYFYNKSDKNKFGAGADLYYEELYLKDLQEKNFPADNAIDKVRLGIKLCYSYNIGRISLPFETGIYAGAKINPEGLIFSRIGVRYTTKNGIMILFGLKTHLGVAYHFDYGIGYRLNFCMKKKITT